jgi:N utilization substance protein B
LQLLFEEDVNPGRPVEEMRQFVSRRVQSADLAEFCLSLVLGVQRNRGELDVILAGTATNWSLERMAATDRNVLRLGAYEILYTDTPHKVAINEAVELAKRFGSGQSAAFVNGILDRFVEHRDQA